LRIFGNKVLRKIFGFETEERAFGWRKFHNSEILNLYISLKVKQSMEEEGM
jgi:hypothetical protein